MGNKINPNAIRIGFTKDWVTSWFGETPASYQVAMHRDLKLRREIMKRFKMAGVQDISIKMVSNGVEIVVAVAKPGMAIGRAGKLIEAVKTDLTKMAGVPVSIKPIEVAEPALAARVVAQQIAEGIGKRRPEKMLVNKAIERAVRRGVLGIKILVAGRIRASVHSNKVEGKAGRVPLQTIRADIDYAFETAYRKDAGIFGVKVWVYKGDKYTK